MAVRIIPEEGKAVRVLAMDGGIIIPLKAASIFKSVSNF